MAAAAQWLANFAITVSFPCSPTSDWPSPTGSTPFFALLSFFFVAKYVKETKGRELEDM